MIKNPLEEKVRGWWFPIFLVELYESRTINAEEFLLLGKINSFADCRVSNRWLAEWWGAKTPQWVSHTLNKLQKMGLIRLKFFRDGRRRIRTCFTGEEGWY